MTTTWQAWSEFPPEHAAGGHTSYNWMEALPTTRDICLRSLPGLGKRLEMSLSMSRFIPKYGRSEGFERTIVGNVPRMKTI